MARIIALEAQATRTLLSVPLTLRIDACKALSLLYFSITIFQRIALVRAVPVALYE